MTRITIPIVLILMVVPAVAAAESDPTPGSLSTLGEEGQCVDLPLKHTRVSVEVTGFAARTTVSQRFHNPFQYPIEALYTFPLGDQSAVDRFEMQIGDRIVRGEVHPRAKARKIYEEARDEGRQAALLEQVRPNVFSQQVANILPGEGIVVRLRTVETLEYSKGRFSYRFPLVVGPRYIPGNAFSRGTDPRMDTSRLPKSRANRAPRRRSGRDIDIEVVLDAGIPVRDLASTNHEVKTTRRGEASLHVLLKEAATIRNSDFVLSWEVATNQDVTGLLAHRDTGDGAFTVLLQTRAEIREDEVAAKQILLVLDTSGSMSGAPIRHSKNFATEALKHLGPDDTFNVITFAGGSETLFSEPVPNTPEDVEKAVEWIRKAEGRGGTEMLRGLTAAAANASDPDRYRMIVFLTDGYIGNEQQIFTAIDMLPDDVRVFALGIGGSVNHHLLNGMAKHGGGACVVIDDGEVAEAVEDFRIWVTRPYLTDLEIDWGSLPVDSVYPKEIPDLFANQNLNLVGRYFGGGTGTVTLSGRLGGRPWENSFDVILPERNANHGALKSVWARRAIDDLLDAHPSGMPDAARDEVIDLAVKYQLMSPFTSFVAVDYRTVTDPGSAVPVEVEPPIVPIDESLEEMIETAAAVAAGLAAQPAAIHQQAAMMTETVKVTAAGQVVRLTDTAKSTVFSEEFVQDLPVPGRFYQNVLTLAPGVQDADGDGNPNVHGSRARDFKATVSGVSNVDPFTGQQMSQINPNSIEEMEIITVGAGAEFSRARGGFAQIIQKQGSNEFEATADWTWRPDATDGRSEGDFASGRFGVYSSGPIVKDRAWYRINMSWLKSRNAVDRLGTLGTRTDDDAELSAALTWQVSPRNKLSFQFDRRRTGDGSIDLSSMTGPDAATSLSWHQNRASMHWTLPVSPKLLVETTVALQDAASGAFPAGVGSNRCVAGPLAGASCLDLAVGSLSGLAHRHVSDLTDRFVLKSRAVIYGGRWLGGSHEIRTGIEWAVDRYRRNLDRGGNLTRTTDGSWIARLAPSSRSDAAADGLRWALWIEDEIRIRHNLSLKAGLRLEETRLDHVAPSSVDPSAELNRYLGRLSADPNAVPLDVAAGTFTGYEDVTGFLTGLEPSVAGPIDCGALCWQQQRPVATREQVDRTIASTVWAPNVQLDWDPKSNSKNRLFIGYDRRHGDLHNALALVGQEPVTVDLAVMVGSSGVTPAPGAAASVNAQVISDRLQVPFQDEWVLGFEREIFAETSLSIQRIRRNGRNQLRSIDRNHRPGDFGRCVPGTVAPIIDSADPLFGRFPFGGDGVLDDCTGPTGVPDGVLDLYVQSPLWGDLIEIVSDGRAQYDAWEVTVDRRQYRSWKMAGSYTFARHRGDGDPFNAWIGDERGLTERHWAPQSDDVRHLVKLAAKTITPWGFTIGGTFKYASGSPFSDLHYSLSPDVLPPGLQGVGVELPRPRLEYADGRNNRRGDAIWTLDLRVVKNLYVGGINLEWYGDVFNVLDQQDLVVQNALYGYGRLIDGLLDARLRNGRSVAVGMRLDF